MKKALAGPAKRTAKKKPERRAMIAAARQRIRAARAAAGRRLRGAVPATRKLDRAADRQLRRAWPLLARGGRAARSAARRAGRRLRPAGALLFRLLSVLERRLLRLAAGSRRAATRISAVLTPQRAICLTIAGAAVCLVVAQFVEYRAVEVGQQGYAGLPAAAEAPTVGGETAGQASAYLLVPVGLLAGALAAWAAIDKRRRGLGRIVFALGLLSLAVVLIVDLPTGLDAGAEAARFSGAEAVLHDGFYAQIAAAAGLMLGGLLLSMKALRTRKRHGYRPRKPSMARTQRGRRRARTSGA